MYNFLTKRIESYNFKFYANIFINTLQNFQDISYLPTLNEKCHS